MDKESRRNRYRIQEPPPALVFFKIEYSLYSVIKRGVANGLFTEEEADNNHEYAINELRKFLEGKVKKYLKEGEYKYIGFFTGEEPTEENIAKYKQLYL